MSKLEDVLAVAGGLGREDIERLAAWCRAELAEREHVITVAGKREQIRGKVTYRQEYVTNKKGGKKYGPYWYAYFKQGDKLKKRYIGKTLPPDAEARAAGHPELPLTEVSNEHV